MNYDIGSQSLDSAIGDHHKVNSDCLPLVENPSDKSILKDAHGTLAYREAETVTTVVRGVQDVGNTLQELDSLGVPIPSTVYCTAQRDFFPESQWTDTVTITRQPQADTETVRSNLKQYAPELRELGEQVARQGYRIDMKLQNFGLLNGTHVYHDVTDSSSVMRDDAPLEEMAHFLEIGTKSLDECLNAKPVKAIIENWREPEYSLKNTK